MPPKWSALLPLCFPNIAKYSFAIDIIALFALHALSTDSSSRSIWVPPNESFDDIARMRPRGRGRAGRCSANSRCTGNARGRIRPLPRKRLPRKFQLSRPAGPISSKFSLSFNGSFDPRVELFPPRKATRRAELRSIKPPMPKPANRPRMTPAGRERFADHNRPMRHNGQFVHMNQRLMRRGRNRPVLQRRCQRR